LSTEQTTAPATTPAPNSAALYDCRESEELHCSTEEEAIEEWVEFWQERDGDTAEVIAKHAPVDLCGYDRESINAEHFAKGIATRLLEEAIEAFDEDYGSPDGDSKIEDGAEEEARSAIHAALTKLYSRMTVWRCHQVSKRTLDAVEIEARMRAYRPDWFETEVPEADAAATTTTESTP